MFLLSMVFLFIMKLRFPENDSIKKKLELFYIMQLYRGSLFTSNIFNFPFLFMARRFSSFFTGRPVASRQYHWTSTLGVLCTRGTRANVWARVLSTFGAKCNLRLASHLISWGPISHECKWLMKSGLRLDFTAVLGGSGLRLHLGCMHLYYKSRTTSTLMDCALISTVCTRRVTSRVHEKGGTQRGQSGPV